jgi:small conductance mechanosensitive channel
MVSKDRFYQSGRLRRLRIGLICAMLFLISGVVCGQEAATNSDTEYADVRVEGRKLFEVIGVNGLTSVQRAARINRRLENLIGRSQSVRPFNQRDLVSRSNETLITLGDQPILSVMETDAREALLTRNELALLWGGKMALAVADARATRANPLRGAGILIRNSFHDLLTSTLRWLPRLASAIVLWLLFWGLARLIRWGVQGVSNRLRLEANLQQLLRAAAYYSAWAIGVIAILSTLGMESGSIATALGISGFVLGFAFKDILSHFFAGMMLLTGRQFRIGDQIVAKDFEGTVERIELRALHLRTYDNRLVIIPNGEVFTSAVISNTASPHRRQEFVVGIGYDDDIKKAQQIALQAVQQVEGVADDPPSDVLVDELAASTVNLRVRFYTRSQRADYLNVGSECMRQVKQSFDREHITMPTDIQTIIVHNLDEITFKVEQATGILPHANGMVPHTDRKSPLV